MWARAKRNDRTCLVPRLFKIYVLLENLVNISIRLGFVDLLRQLRRIDESRHALTEPLRGILKRKQSLLSLALGIAISRRRRLAKSEMSV